MAADEFTKGKYINESRENKQTNKENITQGNTYIQETGG